MRFVFDESRAVEAAARLLELAGGTMPQARLLRLLYLADRRSLIETGYPVTGGFLVSMRQGPAVSEVVELLTVGVEASRWNAYVSPPCGAFDVRLDAEPGSMHLSEYDAELLSSLNEQFQMMGAAALNQWTRELPEWRDPGREMSHPIDPRVILRDSGASDEEIKHVADEVESVWLFHRLRAS